MISLFSPANFLAQFGQSMKTFSLLQFQSPYFQFNEKHYNLKFVQFIWDCLTILLNSISSLTHQNNSSTSKPLAKLTRQDKQRLKEFVLRTDKVKHLIQTRMLERKRKRSSHHEEMLHRFVVLAAQLGEDDRAWSNK